MTWAAVLMAIIGSSLLSLGGTNGFTLLRETKYYAQSNIMRKPRLWSHWVIAMA